jgi:hypothetical protein
VEEESTIFNMQEAIRNAECIVFLGFAYHKQKMRLLFQHHATPKETKPVFATALGMSDADKQEVSDNLEGLHQEIDEEDEEDDDPGPFGIPRQRLPGMRERIDRVPRTGRAHAARLHRNLRWQPAAGIH